jgi:hypothetical protein
MIASPLQLAQDSNPIDIEPAHREGDAAFLDHSRALAALESMGDKRKLPRGSDRPASTISHF